MIVRKELGIPKSRAVLKDPPTSTDKDMVDLLRYLSGIAIPSPTEQRWSLIPGTHNSQPSGSCNIQNERAVVIPGTRIMGANTYFIASLFSASDSIKVTQDNECIMMGDTGPMQSRVWHRTSLQFHTPQ